MRARAIVSRHLKFALCYDCYQSLLSGKMNVLPDADSFLSPSTCQWQTDEDLNLGMGGIRTSLRKREGTLPMKNRIFNKDQPSVSF